MAGTSSIAANVARLRRDRQLTQEELAAQVGLSRLALGKIERGAVVPRAGTLAELAKVLAVSIGELVTPVRRLENVRFRAGRVHAREQILADVSRRLADYAQLEEELHDRVAFRFPAPVDGSDPRARARAARASVDLQPEQPVRDICGLLEENGVKLFLLETARGLLLRIERSRNRTAARRSWSTRGTGSQWSGGSSPRRTNSDTCCCIHLSTSETRLNCQLMRSETRTRLQASSLCRQQRFLLNGMRRGDTRFWYGCSR